MAARSVIKQGSIKQSCANQMQVLADETRLAVVRLLMQQALHVHELNETLAIEPTLLSHHLRVLRDAGLVQSVRDGKARLYSLTPGVRGRPGRGGLNLGCCTVTFH